jgi:hypothetical protein
MSGGLSSSSNGRRARNGVVEYWSDFVFRLRQPWARGSRLVAVEDEDDDEDENVY